MRLEEARIRNFRSIENLTIRFCDTTVFFGKNDSGKSNILRALEFAMTRGYPHESDFRLTSDVDDPKNVVVTVDLLFVLTDDVDGDDLEEYDQLSLYLGADAISIDASNRGTLAFRTEAHYNAALERYEKSHHIIKNWSNPKSEGNTLPSEAFDVIDFVLLDAHRDIAETIRERRSRWNAELAKTKIDEARVSAIESELLNLGKEIVKASPFLSEAENDLRGATDHLPSSVEISPISRSIDELYRGLDVFVEEQGGVPLSMSVSGSGTRSRAVFMAYGTVLRLQALAAEAAGRPYYCLAALEEPEAHLHPQSQQQLLEVFGTVGTQRVITTHSPYILSAASLDSLIMVQRKRQATTCISVEGLNLDEDQKREVSRYIFRTHGDLLFADAVIMGEGETEEQALPVFFEHRFGCGPFAKGVAIIGVGGVSYRPFLSLFHKLGTKWFILSDGEATTVNTLAGQLRKGLGLEKRPDIRAYTNISVWGNGKDFEAHLIDEGYADVMIRAIDLVEGGDGSGAVYTSNMWSQHNQDTEARKTGQVCSHCGKPIWASGKFDYSGEDGKYRYLEDLLSKSVRKTRYAHAIAEAIISNNEGKPLVPSAVQALLDSVDVYLGGVNR